MGVYSWSAVPPPPPLRAADHAEWCGQLLGESGAAATDHADRV